MLVDLNQIEALPRNRFDVCVVGAGAAGIILARSLAAQGKSVALCEGGLLDYSDESQDTYIGETVGDPYFDLDVCRLRYLGGSTNHWGGMCRNFDVVDFEREDLGPLHKWPIKNKDIEGYLAQACDILGIAPVFRDGEPDPEFGVKTIDIKFSAPVNFNDKYRADIESDLRIYCFLAANLIDLKGDSGRVDSAVFENYAGRSFEITADKFVLAMGGIEVPRFLLWFREKYGGELFSERTPVGRYWMEHPHLKIGEALVETEIAGDEYYGFSGDLLKSLGLLNLRVELDRQGANRTRRLARELLCVAPSLGARIMTLFDKGLVCGVRVRCSWEQPPDPSNRVVLSDREDRFGVPSVVLEWKQTVQERASVADLAKQYNAWMIARGRGRLRLDDWVFDLDADPFFEDLGGNHHIGGARMGDSLETSVVDGNCLLHGSKNLYVAGSSVFTTGGHANPTLPLCQFVLRLADHLAMT